MEESLALLTEPAVAVSKRNTDKADRSRKE